MTEMAAQTSSTKTKGPLVDPGLCRCCRSIKKCRILTSEYEYTGTKEVYSDMFMDCFGLLLSNLEGDPRDSCICATCVTRLRDACAFRQQVLLCEQAFISATMETKQELDDEMAVKAEPLSGCESDTAMDDREADPDYQVSDTESKQEPNVVTEEKAENPPKQRDSRGSFVVKLERLKIPVDGRDAGVSRMTRSFTIKVDKLQAKLDGMLEKPASEPEAKPELPSESTATSDSCEPPAKRRSFLLKVEGKPKRVKKKSIAVPTEGANKPAQKKNLKSSASMAHDEMVYHNAVTIARCSYVCPFLNRTSNYYCYYCKDQFMDPMELREHTLSHNPEEDFESSMEYKKMPKIDIVRVDCRLCSEKIEDISKFKSHIVSVHKKVIHPVTNEFLTFKLELDNVKCTECNESFPYFDACKKHMIDHFGKFICDQCGACFLEQQSLRTHIKSHNKVEKNFPCEICGKNLKSKYSKYLHVLTVHEKKPTVNCYKCDASFLSYALRNRHLIEVHGDKRTFSCKLCDKVYNRRKTLMEHNRRSHLKVYRHQCDLCDQRFFLPSRLKEHMATHTGERNFRCEYCEKSYPRLQSLQEHTLRSHSNERRHKCEICNSVFTQNGSLRNHMKTHHQGFDLESYS